MKSTKNNYSNYSQTFVQCCHTNRKQTPIKGGNDRLWEIYRSGKRSCREQPTSHRQERGQRAKKRDAKPISRQKRKDKRKWRQIQWGHRYAKSMFFI